MDFDLGGYLGTQMNDYINEHYLKNYMLYQLCEDFNRYAQKLKFDIHPRIDELSEMAISSLFIKILNSYQAIIILYRYGLSSQAKSITRISLETLFVLKAIAIDKKHAQVLLDMDSKKIEKFIRKVKVNEDNIFDGIQSKVDLASLESLSQKNKDNHIEIPKVETWAKLSGLTNLYHTMYAVFCDDIHIDIRNLEQYVTVDSAGDIIGLSCLPNTADISNVLLDSLYILSEAIASLNRVFGVGDIKDLEAFEIRALNLREVYKKNNASS
jgi:hypothetical protein